MALPRFVCDDGEFVQRGNALLALHRRQDDLTHTRVDLTGMAHRRNVNRFGARGRLKSQSVGL